MGAQGHPALNPLLLQLFQCRVAVISLFLHSFHQQTAPDPLMFTHQMTHGRTHTHRQKHTQLQMQTMVVVLLSHRESLGECILFYR